MEDLFVLVLKGQKLKQKKEFKGKRLNIENLLEKN